MKNYLLTSAFLFLTAASSLQLAPSETVDDTMATYPAAYFSEYGVVSVNNMLSRIPDIGLALEGSQGPSFSHRVRYDIDNLVFFSAGELRPEFKVFAEKPP